MDAKYYKRRISQMGEKALYMRILLLGSGGQLGQDLHSILRTLGIVKACSHKDVDLTNHLELIKIIENFNPDIIVNAAAYTSVDQAEKNKDLAFCVNAEAVDVMAKEAVKRNIWIIHYSTDYVFNGLKIESYKETDTPHPINIYGASKLLGEQKLTQSGCKHLIFRISWVIGQYGHNFVKTILRLAQQKDILHIINDQYGAPTTTNLISKVTHEAIINLFTPCTHTYTPCVASWNKGIYHLAPKGKITWYEMSGEILRIAKDCSFPLRTHTIYPISTDQYKTPAKRPGNSCLNTSKLEKILPFTLPLWHNDFYSVVTKIIKGEHIA